MKNQVPGFPDGCFTVLVPMVVVAGLTLFIMYWVV